MTSKLLCSLVIAAGSVVSCYAMKEDASKKPLVRESEIDIESMTHTCTEEYTDVQHNDQAYQVAKVICKGGPLDKEHKNFVFFTAHRKYVSPSKNENISQQEFDVAKKTPNAKRYVKQEYFAYLKGAQTEDNSVKAGWIATCSTSHNGQKTYKSSCQRNSCYSPEIDTSESVFEIVQLAYFNGLTQRAKLEETKKVSFARPKGRGFIEA